MYHALGKASEAIDEYSKVKTRFPDASETIDFFTHKAISLDEVTTVKPADQRKLNLHYRNIAEVSLKVYRIDLMKFGLMQRNLDRITAINLAGIKPYHEETVKLGDGKDYRDMELELPLKEEGAYLVVCRGDNLYASGLMLVSPLSLEVQEDATSGRVRVTIKDATKDAFLGDVHVKVIGSANDEFRSGETDLRGLFIADDIRGTSTVIARANDNLYAFYRGKTVLQNVEAEKAPQSEAAAQQSMPENGKMMQGKDLLRGNIEGQNGIFQREQQMNYDNLLNNSRKGLMPSEAY